MPLTVILAVGLDSSLLAGQNSVWKSAGYFVTSTGSINDAINHLRDGDFDVVLLGHSIPADSRERLTYLLRASGSRTPVVCVTDSANHRDSFADATIRNEPTSLLQCIGELMAERAKTPSPRRAMPDTAA
jgi:DNA-binding NtrC family response regulator